MVLASDSCYRMIYHLTGRVISTFFIHVPVAYERRTTLNAQTDIPLLIRQLRERTGLCQEKFAAKFGVTLPTINRWENGSRGAS